jgi:hypothetical protein
MDTRPMVHVTLTQTLGLLFYANPPGCPRDDEDCGDNDWTVLLGENQRELTPAADDARNLTPLEMENLRSVMVMLWMCVKRIAAYPDNTVYPSAEYLMRKLPTWLHPYFPMPISPYHRDRDCVVEFDYRPAPASYDWAEFIDGCEFCDQCSPSLQLDIPWYENEEESNSESSEDDE